MAELNQMLCLPNGRKLGYSVLGEGKPVFYFHGTASSRLEVLLLKELTSKKPICLIGVDRPGAGLSTFTFRNSLQDFNSDINYLACHLAIDRFGLIGWSGGGPYVLTYLAFFPERITHAVVVGSPALPFDVATAHNNYLARFAMEFPALGFLVLKKHRTEVLNAKNDIEAFLNSRNGKNMLRKWAKDDARFFTDKTWLSLMYDAMAEGFRQGDDSLKAVIQEHQLFMNEWPEEVSNIPTGKVDVWQGTDDKTCRVDNGYRIAKTISGAHFEVFEGKGHCLMFDNLEKLGVLFTV